MIAGFSHARRLLPLSIALALGVPTAEAATITVTNGGDAGTASTCTLRQALTSANADAAGTSGCVAGAGDDTVVFASSLRNSTITLAGQPLSITSNVTLTGSGQIIDANDASPVMYIDTGAVAQLSYLTLTGGNSGYAPAAGGLNVSSPPALNQPGKTFAEARAQRRSTPIKSAPAAGQGTTLTHVTITGNTSKYVGGLLLQDGYTTLYESTISNNTALGNASFISGGVAAFSSAFLAYGSTISGNTVPAGDLEPAGAIAGYFALIGLVDTTISGNSANGTDYVAGGISESSVGASGKYGVVVLSGTISGNSATATGTNQTGGILIGAQSGNGGAYLVNSIVDGNTASKGTTPNLDIVGASQVGAKYSLLGPELQATLTGNSNVFAADPRLGPLADNGGPTLTRALLAGSPAINAGSNTATSNSNFDQRGPGYARIVGPAIDIGAFELQSTVAAASVPVPALSVWSAGLLGALLGFFGIAVRARPLIRFTKRR